MLNTFTPDIRKNIIPKNIFFNLNFTKFKDLTFGLNSKQFYQLNYRMNKTETIFSNKYCLDCFKFFYDQFGKDRFFEFLTYSNESYVLERLFNRLDSKDELCDIYNFIFKNIGISKILSLKSKYNYKFIERLITSSDIDIINFILENFLKTTDAFKNMLYEFKSDNTELLYLIIKLI